MEVISINKNIPNNSTMKELQILFIDDNPEDRALTIKQLKKEFYTQIEEITDSKGFECALEKNNFDIVITDYDLKWTNGMKILHSVKTKYPSRPVIMFTEIDKEEIIVKAMKEDLDAYVVKTPKQYLTIPCTVLSVLKNNWKQYKSNKYIEQITKELEEKRLLLHELNHLTENNMYNILSLINVYSNSIDNKYVLNIMQDIKNIILSMALIHQQLFQSSNLKVIDFNTYIRDLTSQLYHSYGVNVAYIKLEIVVKEVFLDIYHATPCGLIISELISNAITHGFPMGRKGKIQINMHHIDEKKIELIISDNGVGFPKDIDFKNTSTLGLKLVNGFVQQLDGTIEKEDNHGSTFRIMFEIDDKISVKKMVLFS